MQNNTTIIEQLLYIKLTLKETTSIMWENFRDAIIREREKNRKNR